MSKQFLNRPFASLAMVTPGLSAGPNVLNGRIESLPVGPGKVNATLHPPSHTRHQTAHREEEPLQLGRIQFAVGAHAGTHIEPERPHFFDCLAYVLGCE